MSLRDLCHIDSLSFVLVFWAAVRPLQRDAVARIRAGGPLEFLWRTQG